ncbi:DsbA family oxidoreductase [Phytoactinopolyspora limicola]|uniref:DsbA family oxidoreductase n=1 Tax=Phytoactinopolyspora limicola TaxID=2715536 RepID=UPI00140B696B|nr:DsbA family oxidoreductase [Phytoactinopolyspora limicola]
MRVEVTIDLVCVWSYLSYARFQRVAGEYRDGGGELDVVFRPFQLDPTATSEGVPKHEVERRYFGADFDAEAAVAELNVLGADVGVSFGRHTIWTNTFEAHRLISVASDQGLGEQMVERLFRAQNTDEVNIADRSVLTRLAAEVGVRWSDAGANAVRAELDKVRRSGIRGVPVFAFDGAVPLVGSQSERAFRQALGGS